MTPDLTATLDRLTTLAEQAEASHADVLTLNASDVLLLCAALREQDARVQALEDLFHRGEWFRNQDGRTHLAIHVADHADLSCRATREDAINAAIKARLEQEQP